MAHARAWAIRCTLELHQHRQAIFTTLTYNNKNLPPTLQIRDTQLFLKRLRKTAQKDKTIGTLRFFLSGEYGETNARPHYHAIIYGLRESHGNMVENAWQKGFCRTYNAGPLAIAYVAGYVNKKAGYKLKEREQVDPETGEVYTWKPPFINMSRVPGIGHHAKKYWQNWRSFAILNGNKTAVPRYYHEEWKKNATPEQKEELEYEKYRLALDRDTTKERIEAAEKIAIAMQMEQSYKRKYG